MLFRSSFLTLVAMLLTACARNQAPPSAVKLAVVSGFPDGRLCMAAPDSNIRNGVRLPIDSIPLAGDSSPTGQGVVEVIAPAQSLCSGLWGEYGWADYLVRVVQEPAPAYGRGPAVALVGASATFLMRDDQLEADLDGDGTPEVFRSCTSNEGLHLTAWKGQPLKARRVWHNYFALHYDVEPSCVEADYNEP